MSAAIYDIPLQTITGDPSSLAGFKGKVVLVVNVASKCGLTPQYEGLEKLYELYKGQGLVIAGFPANDFKQQEPGTNEEIQSFCTSTTASSFRSSARSPLSAQKNIRSTRLSIAAQPRASASATFHFATSSKATASTPNPEPEITWNFEKFLVSRDGEVVARFSPDTQPDAPELISAIESELAKVANSNQRNTSVPHPFHSFIVQWVGFHESQPPWRQHPNPATPLTPLPSLLSLPHADRAFPPTPISLKTPPPPTCARRAISPWSGILGARPPLPARNASTSPSFSTSERSGATGATSWTASPMRTPKSPR